MNTKSAYAKIQIIQSSGRTFDYTQRREDVDSLLSRLAFAFNPATTRCLVDSRPVELRR